MVPLSAIVARLIVFIEQVVEVIVVIRSFEDRLDVIHEAFWRIVVVWLLESIGIGVGSNVR